ncbi:MAG: outer membrane lipid asymmetry maintenance protein MlaD [Proteobacteria bacterium]|nr:MAG: outer membrane lipid asymmetry maintenance protein MlaD [Pseudomonadota bacterium]QKK11887.1 MAG: outer membrane lipid asymmetry maintenance protein MlaD [Pseudomonadota bacterium]
MFQSRTTEIWVGLFVAAGLAALFVLAMKVSNLSGFTDEKGYTLVARFENIGGLKVRSPVTVSGVRIGRVAGISYDNENYEALVTLNVSAHYDKLPTDTSASILTAGLLGEQYIGLEPGGEEQFLKDGDSIQLTQSALVLEKIIGQFLFSKAAEGVKE